MRRRSRGSRGCHRHQHTLTECRKANASPLLNPPSTLPLCQHLSSNLPYTLAPSPTPFSLLPPCARQTDPAGLWHNHFISPSTGTAARANSDFVIHPHPPTGTTVAQVTATDADDPVFGNNARLIYSILQGEPYFSIEPKTGTADGLALA